MLDLKDWVKSLNNSNYPIVVEGKKDKAALRNIGINNDIITLNKPLYAIVESLQDEEIVVILTDFDIEGKKLYSKLSEYFFRFGVKLDRKYRQYLIKNTELSQIEGIDTYMGGIDDRKSD